MPRNDRPRTGFPRWALAIALVGVAACGLLVACTTVHPPTYSEAELQAQCERGGGWWRGSLIPDYCEYQSTFP